MQRDAQIPRILSIAGTDPTGGAGIQADLKSIAANGGYGMAAVTALVAQNTHGVRSVHVPPPSFLLEQLDAVSDDVEIDGVKIGMLATTGIIHAVSGWLDRVAPPVVVIDPVMVTTSGDRLLDKDAEQALRELATRAHLLTPNIPELAILADEPVTTDWHQVLGQAGRVSARFGVLVLAKGGHLHNESAPDALVGATGDAISDAPGDSPSAAVTVTEFPGVRIETTNTHGTGCSLSSAIVTRYASVADWAEAVGESKRWLTESIRHGAALKVGSGHGPVSHFAGLWERGGTTSRPTPDEVADQWWEHIGSIRHDIDELPFVKALGDGTLDRDQFLWYLAQDSLYLRDYSRGLAAASSLAPAPNEQAFWAQSAQGAIVGERQLHEEWIPVKVLADVQPSATTTAYLNHQRAAAARGDYRVLISALLPCFWIYQDVGARLHSLSHPGHPYGSWLDTYADEAFAESTAKAIDIVTRTAASADDATRQAMREAFWISAAYERAFFAASTSS